MVDWGALQGKLSFQLLFKPLVQRGDLMAELVFQLRGGHRLLGTMIVRPSISFSSVTSFMRPDQFEFLASQH
jgi:hypothetical protein